MYRQSDSFKTIVFDCTASKEYRNIFYSLYFNFKKDSIKEKEMHLLFGHWLLPKPIF